MDKTDAEWIWNQMGLLLSYHRARGQRLIAPAGGNPDVRLCARSAPLDGGSIFGFLGGTSWLEAVMLKRRIICLAILWALVLSTRSSRAQGGLTSGIYQIVSGRYTECCGIAGPAIYPLANATQGFVELTVDPQQNLARMTFLGQDMHTIFSIFPDGPRSGFNFMFTNGMIFADHIQFGEPMPPPGPLPDQPYFNYSVSNSNEVLRINGVVITPCPGCADVFTQFEHTNVVAVLMPTVVKPRLSLPAVSTDGIFRFTIFDGQWGQTDVIEASTDLITWTPVSTNVFPPTACPVCPFIEFGDPASANLAHRFYRAFSFP